VIVINPLSELGLRRFRLPSDTRSFLFGSEVSDLYLQPHIGGDTHLFTAVLKGLIEAGALDRSFIDASTSDWDAVRASCEAATWDDLVAGSGVPRDQINECVRILAESRSGIFMWAMGLTHHVTGTDTIRALANIALALGFLGRPGSGLMPIRGHSNVQGVGSVGVSPRMKDAFASALADRYGIDPSMPPGYDTYAGMAAAHEGAIDAAVMLGGNLWGSNPDSLWATEALGRIGTTVSLTTKLNQGHFRGRGRVSLVLPVLARDEEEQSTTQESMFNFVRLSDGGTPNVAGDMRSEVAVLAGLAARILPEDRFDWDEITSHEGLRRAIAASVPGYEQAADIGSSHREFTIPGRVMHDATFPTADGRARFHAVPLPVRPDDDLFTVMTIRSEGQFNTVVYDEEDLYRGNTRRDVVMMSDDDAQRMGIREGDAVRVSNGTGSMDVRVAIVDIRSGNLAMYYPEANVLVGHERDPESLTPAFKAVRVRLETRAT